MKFFQKKLLGLPILAVICGLMAGGVALAAVAVVSNVWTSPDIVVNPPGGGGSTVENSPLVIGSSDFTSNLSIATGGAATFTISLSNPSVAGAPGYTDVRVRFEITGATAVTDLTLEYQDGTTWYSIPCTLEGGKLVGYFGPTEGFAVPTGYNATTPIRATFHTAGTYSADVFAEIVS